MHRQMAQMVGGMLAALVVLAWAGCTGLITVPVGEEREETRTVELGGARSAQVTVVMGVGDLRLAGGASAGLMEARFRYNVGEWRPQVEYAVRDGRGYLRVAQPSGPDVMPLGNVRYEWDLRLPEGVPLDLRVELGAGRAELALGGLSLGWVDMQMGAGEATLDLTGAWSQDMTVHIQGGVGHLKVLLPRDVGVRVQATGGIGHINAAQLQRDGQDYVNDAYGRAAVTLHLDIEAGVGAIDLLLE